MERMDDLQFAGLHLIQDPDRFCFGTDAVLLSAFTNVKPHERALDLCAGTGVIATLLKARTGARMEALEIDPALCDMFRRSCAYNRLNIPVHCMDMRDAARHLGHGVFDAVVCNPPYFTGGPASEAVPLARRDDCCSPEDLFRCASRAIKFGGDFYLVHKPEKLAQLITVGSTFSMEAKELTLIRHRTDSPISMIVLRFKKGGKPGLKLYEYSLFDSLDHPTDFYREVYHMKGD